jgi:hypothetical protein
VYIVYYTVDIHTSVLTCKEIRTDKLSQEI